MNNDLRKLIGDIKPELEARVAGFAAAWPGVEINAAKKVNEDLISRIDAITEAAPDTPPEGMMNGFVPVGWGIFDRNGKLSSFTHGKEGADAIASEYPDGDYYVDRLYA